MSEHQNKMTVQQVFDETIGMNPKFASVLPELQPLVNDLSRLSDSELHAWVKSFMFKFLLVQMLLEQLALKFGPVPEALRARVFTATAPELNRLFAGISSAQSLDELFN